MNWNDLIIRPQGARAKAQSSPPARFTSHSSEGSHNNKNQNKKTAYTDFFTKPGRDQRASSPRPSPPSDGREGVWPCSLCALCVPLWLNDCELPLAALSLSVLCPLLSTFYFQPFSSLCVLCVLLRQFKFIVFSLTLEKVPLPLTRDGRQFFLHG